MYIIFYVLQLQSDCARIILNLTENKAIEKDIAEEFKTKFVSRWPQIAQAICNLAVSSQVADLKEFKKCHQECLKDGKFLCYTFFCIINIYPGRNEFINYNYFQVVYTIKTLRLSMYAKVNITKPILCIDKAFLIF